MVPETAIQLKEGADRRRARSCAVPRLANGRPVRRPLAISAIGGKIPTRAAGRGTADDRDSILPTAIGSTPSRSNGCAAQRPHWLHMTAGDQQPAPSYHSPVMCREVVELLAEVPAGVMLDATIGGGGHAAAALRAAPQLDLVGIDRDPEALKASAAVLADFGDRVVLRHARFDAIPEVLEGLGKPQISACLFDLGVSSAQLDSPERGFSYRLEGPLDMRMDQTATTTAADIVNHVDEQYLAAMLYRNADERHSRRIAAAIVAKRPFTTTGQLAQVVAEAVPGGDRRRSHPARRTFQALRIEVNNELEILESALTASISRLGAFGRCVVISYHSGEDRIVKSVFRRVAGENAPPRPGLPPAPDTKASVRLLGRRARRPTDEEKSANHRASAARLRAVERLAAHL